ncbi:MAG: PHP domain-containing protein [Nitrospirae bacterium]|nr:PHP domain-containing protein [Nitrospirota bacterium]
MLIRYKADLHIHTCLSPCAELEMTPSDIVGTALEKGINLIAITDHNSAENVPAARKASANTDVTVLAGMEISSAEEAHILALFNDVESVMKLQDIVYKNLLPGGNDEKLFGEQIVVNENNEVLGFNNRLLIGATTLPAQDIVDTIRSLGGLAVASHIDRETFGIISQLGFIPERLKFDALEISPNTGREQAEFIFSEYKSFAWVTSSDAHVIKDIGRRTVNFFMKGPTIEEMALAFRNMEGRRLQWGVTHQGT